jgi:hypothetical protein
MLTEDYPDVALPGQSQLQLPVASPVVAQRDDPRTKKRPVVDGRGVPAGVLLMAAVEQAREVAGPPASRRWLRGCDPAVAGPRLADDGSDGR